MKNSFKIENALLELTPSDIEQSEFIVRSTPYCYSVKFITNKELKEILSINKKNNGAKHFLFIDKNINKLYRTKFWKSERVITIVANEKNKTVKSALTLVDALNKSNFTKKEKLISIGGGITQDVTAFARAIFKRGIDWIYVPTTLLSMSDSCIGAKSAINYGETKNLVGLFSAPREVFINIEILNTLSNRDILSGYGEIIKLCIIGGEYTIEKLNMVKLLQKGILLNNIDILIKTALMVKKTVIIEDEFENNIRKALNYGHTIGHAIEPIVDFKIPHGIAVMIGMVVENIVSNAYGFLSLEDCDKLNSIIIHYIDPLSVKYLKSISIKDLFTNMKKDKKNENAKISFAVPISIGCFKILHLENDSKLLKTVENAINSIAKN